MANHDNKRNLNFEIFALITPRDSLVGLNMQKGPNFQKSSLLQHMLEKSRIKMSMKHFTKIIKSMIPGSGVQALGRHQYGYIVQMY